MLDPFWQFLLVAITALLALAVCYMFFDNNFTYFLYFEVLFLALFVAFDVIDYYYLAIIVLVFALLIYQTIAPAIRERADRGEERG